MTATGGRDCSVGETGLAENLFLSLSFLFRKISMVSIDFIEYTCGAAQ
jgi:hypothetical protein